MICDIVSFSAASVLSLQLRRYHIPHLDIEVQVVKQARIQYIDKISEMKL